MDINADLGESFGVYTLGNDPDLMPLITSVNVACGFHAGDPQVMAATVALAKQYGVAVGAHPSWPDLQGFGRRMMIFQPEEVERIILYQIGALAGFCNAAGITMQHVKPHGALYNQAAREPALATAIARAVKQFSPSLVLFGLAGSELIVAGEKIGLRVANEGFPERVYEPDGSLRSRSLPGALIEDPKHAAAQALQLAREGIIIRTGSQTRTIQVDTLCIHGDSPGAIAITRSVRAALQDDGIPVKGLN